MDFDGWTYDDFLRRLEAIRNFGSFDELAGRIPGMDALLQDMDVDIHGQLEPIERILRAMTAEERLDPKLLEGDEGPERREAIAERADTSLSAVESLIWQFQRLREMLSERSLDEVTRDLMEEATPKREAWQDSAEAWKARAEDEESEVEEDDDFDEDLADVDELLEDLDEISASDGSDEDEESASEDLAVLTSTRLDDLLRKISASGFDSLTPSERDDLERASSALRDKS